MKCFSVFFLTLASFLSTVRCIGLAVQSETLVGTPTLVAWNRDATDNPPVEFDLRFVQQGADVGLAFANIGADLTDQFGNVMVTFPSAGQFALAAVVGNPPNTVLGMSNTITAIASVASTSSSAPVTAPTVLPMPPPQSSTGAASTSTSSATSTASPSSAASTSSSATSSSSTSSASSSTHSASATAIPRPISAVKQPANVTAIVAGILGTFLLIALLIALFLFLRHRRREQERKWLDQRISFHKDLMVQRRDRDLPSIPTSMASSAENIAPGPPPPPSPRVPPRINVDVEQGFPLPPPSPSVNSSRGSKERASGPGPIPPSPIVGHLSPHPTRLGSGHIVPSPKGPRPSLKVKKTELQTVSVTPPLRSAPVVATAPSTTTKPDSAAAAASVSSRMAKRTRRQKQITNRISMLSKQMAEVKALFDAEQEEGKRAEHKHVLEEMQREMVWLRDQEEGAWALGLTDVSPPGWARYMTP